MRISNLGAGSVNSTLGRNWVAKDHLVTDIGFEAIDRSRRT